MVSILLAVKFFVDKEDIFVVFQIRVSLTSRVAFGGIKKMV